MTPKADKSGPTRMTQLGHAPLIFAATHNAVARGFSGAEEWPGRRRKFISGVAGHQRRADHQPEDRQGARPSFSVWLSLRRRDDELIG